MCTTTLRQVKYGHIHEICQPVATKANKNGNTATAANLQDVRAGCRGNIFISFAPY